MLGVEERWTLCGASLDTAELKLLSFFPCSLYFVEKDSMARKAAGAVEDPAPPPRRSSCRGRAASVEEKSPLRDAPQNPPQGRSGGRRVAGGSRAGDPALAMMVARGRTRGTVQQDEAAAPPVPKRASARPVKAAAFEEMPPAEEEPAAGSESGNESEQVEAEYESASPAKASVAWLAPARARRKRRTSAATAKRRRAAAAKARSQAANEVSSDEGDGEDAGARLIGGAGGDGGGKADTGAAPKGSRWPRFPLGDALTPSPHKTPSAPFNKRPVSVEDDAFIRPQKGLGDKNLQRRKALEPEPRPRTIDEEVVEEVVEDAVEDAVEQRPTARRQTKAVQKELAQAARVSALEDLGSRMMNMLGQLKKAGVHLDFANTPAQFAAPSHAAGPSAVASPAKAYSRADNFKGDGSSREGKPMTEGRRYGAVWGSYEDFDVGLNVSDYSRKNNDAPRDNTELFYPLMRKQQNEEERGEAEPLQRESTKGKERAPRPANVAPQAPEVGQKRKPAFVAPSTPDAVGQKRKRPNTDDGEQERPSPRKAGDRAAGASNSKVAKVGGLGGGDAVTPRRPFTPRNASSRGRAADAMDVDAWA
ncbi:hypothetical protein AURDEDRAFT_130490 [Auricularia subglabra TFB-10046 SS5]|nr:hypothetical protein AURDEDRAFT_130490 [Auricularia subglabra TFB-10046 SS5]